MPRSSTWTPTIIWTRTPESNPPAHLVHGRGKKRPDKATSQSEMACIQRRLTIEATLQLPLVVISYQK
jgi:hypothetical protein